MAKELTNRARADIDNDVRSITRILCSEVLTTEPRSPFVEDSLTRLLICLRDLISKSSVYAGRHVNFPDDVIPSPAGARKRIRNVANLIEYMRDAVSHPDAANHMLLNNVMVSFGRVFGKKNYTMFRIAGVDMDPPCDYDDDIAFTFGYQRIYLRRHIIRAFEEAKRNLQPLLN